MTLIVSIVGYAITVLIAIACLIWWYKEMEGEGIVIYTIYCVVILFLLGVVLFKCNT